MKEIMQKLELKNQEEIINYFPYKYIDYSLNDLNKDYNEKVVNIYAKVINISNSIYLSKNLKKFIITVFYKNKNYNIIVYNQDYLLEKLYINQHIFIRGKYNYKRNEIILNELFFYFKKGIYPLYHLKNDIKNNDVIKLINLSLNKTIFNEEIPSFLIKKYHLISKKEAYYNIHKGINLEKTFFYFKYKEVLNFLTKLKLKYNENHNKKYNKFKKINYNFINNILKENNIKLTNDQIKACKEIFKDIESNKRMYRMLIGDVGCGKTLVSLLTLASICKQNYQGVLLVPSEILANQHYQYFKKILKKFNVFLLTKNVKNKEEIKEKLKTKEIDILIATTSILENDYQFNNLGIVVIDEQHRFGVNQREKLIKKGKNVDVLFMSATPIPRTLALINYGEMDISFIKEFPFKKRNVITKLIKEKDVKEKIDYFINKNKKIFVVCPAIESDKKRNVNYVYNNLKKYYLNDINFIHGKLNDYEKENIIQDFKNDKFHILVSTTVIEVGIDIKEVNAIFVYDANNFGLSTLHQLRGRVGRDGKRSYAFFIYKNDNKRLKVLEKFNDGFKVSEFDLFNRKEGDLVGNKQSGKSNFKFFDINKDQEILNICLKDSENIIKFSNNLEEYHKYIDKL